MYDAMKRHEVQVLRKAGFTRDEIAKRSGVSRRCVTDILKEPLVEGLVLKTVESDGKVGRPSTALPFTSPIQELFKTELEVAPVYLKKPRRAAGLLHATYLAMTVDALIERTVRQAMKRLGLESLPILPEGRLTKTPTTARLLEMFTNVAWYEFERAGDTVTFPIQLSPLQKQLLRLLDMDPSTYA